MLQEAVETDKFRVSLVFKGTTDGMKKEEPKTE